MPVATRLTHPGANNDSEQEFDSAEESRMNFGHQALSSLSRYAPCGIINGIDVDGGIWGQNGDDQLHRHTVTDVVADAATESAESGTYAFVIVYDLARKPARFGDEENTRSRTQLDMIDPQSMRGKMFGTQTQSQAQPTATEGAPAPDRPRKGRTQSNCVLDSLEIPDETLKGDLQSIFGVTPGGTISPNADASFFDFIQILNEQGHNICVVVDNAHELNNERGEREQNTGYQGPHGESLMVGVLESFEQNGNSRFLMIERKPRLNGRIQDNTRHIPLLPTSTAETRLALEGQVSPENQPLALALAMRIRINKLLDLLDTQDGDETQLLNALRALRADEIKKMGQGVLEASLTHIHKGSVYLQAEHKQFWEENAQDIIEGKWDLSSGCFIAAGPPGTGKSILPKYVASLMKIPYVKLKDMGTEGWAGVSLQKIQVALETVHAQKPCVLHIDEVDKILPINRHDRSSGNNDNGALGYLQDKLGDPEFMRGIIVIGTSNDPDALGEALTREERFGSIIYMGPPKTSAEKVGVFKAVWHQFPTIQEEAIPLPADEFIEALLTQKEIPEYITGVVYKERIIKTAIKAYRKDRSRSVEYYLADQTQRLILNPPVDKSAETDAKCRAIHNMEWSIDPPETENTVDQVTVDPAFEMASILLKKLQDSAAALAAQNARFQADNTGDQSVPEVDIEPLEDLLARATQILGAEADTAKGAISEARQIEEGVEALLRERQAALEQRETTLQEAEAAVHADIEGRVEAATGRKMAEIAVFEAELQKRLAALHEAEAPLRAKEASVAEMRAEASQTLAAIRSISEEIIALSRDGISAFEAAQLQAAQEQAQAALARVHELECRDVAALCSREKIEESRTYKNIFGAFATEIYPLISNALRQYGNQKDNEHISHVMLTKDAEQWEAIFGGNGFSMNVQKVTVTGEPPNKSAQLTVRFDTPFVIAAPIYSQIPGSEGKASDSHFTLTFDVTPTGIHGLEEVATNLSVYDAAFNDGVLPKYWGEAATYKDHSGDYPEFEFNFDALGFTEDKNFKCMAGRVFVQFLQSLGYTGISSKEIQYYYPERSNPYPGEPISIPISEDPVADTLRIHNFWVHFDTLATRLHSVLLKDNIQDPKIRQFFIEYMFVPLIDGIDSIETLTHVVENIEDYCYGLDELEAIMPLLAVQKRNYQSVPNTEFGYGGKRFGGMRVRGNREHKKYLAYRSSVRRKFGTTMEQYYSTESLQMDSSWTESFRDLFTNAYPQKYEVELAGKYQVCISLLGTSKKIKVRNRGLCLVFIPSGELLSREELQALKADIDAVYNQ